MCARVEAHQSFQMGKNKTTTAAQKEAHRSLCQIKGGFKYYLGYKGLWHQFTSVQTGQRCGFNMTQYWELQ
jgi:hypothetical protein